MTQGLDEPTRIALLQGYVDTLLFRDVVERFGVSQVTALRWLTRHCLRNPARALSVHGVHRDLKSQGQGLAKDTVYEMLGYLTDAFRVSTLPLATESAKRQRSNPRKVFPVDHGMVHAFDASGRANLGHVLETAVFNALQGRARDVGYVRTVSGFDVDFLARLHRGSQALIQVCADASAPETLEREVRGLHEAAVEHPGASQHLLVLTRDRLPWTVGDDIRVQPAYEWLLDDGHTT